MTRYMKLTRRNNTLLNKNTQLKHKHSRGKQEGSDCAVNEGVQMLRTVGKESIKRSKHGANAYKNQGLPKFSLLPYCQFHVLN